MEAKDILEQMIMLEQKSNLHPWERWNQIRALLEQGVLMNKISDAIESSFLRSKNKYDFKVLVMKEIQELRENSETTNWLDVFYPVLRNIWELGRASAKFQAICNCASHRAFPDENVFFEDCPVHGINGTEPYGEYSQKRRLENE